MDGEGLADKRLGEKIVGKLEGFIEDEDCCMVEGDIEWQLGNNEDELEVSIGACVGCAAGVGDRVGCPVGCCGDSVLSSEEG